MPPFRNFLARKPQANADSADKDGFDEAQSSPVSIRGSEDRQPPEYKLSGMEPIGLPAMSSSFEWKMY